MGCGVIIAAAGQGKRMSLEVNKIFVELNNKPIIIYSLEKFIEEKWVDEIVIVANPQEIAVVKQLLKKYNMDIHIVVSGGTERQMSIRNGLAHINSKYVMIHDAARPFISSEKLNNLYKEVQNSNAAVLGVPAKDTIKQIDKYNKIKCTLERESLWLIQTPQAFGRSILKEAFEKAEKENFLGTDDSSLVERLGIEVQVIMGDYQNIKITTPEDLILAQAIIDNWSDFK